jgi:HEAT repeat protein
VTRPRLLLAGTFLAAAGAAAPLPAQVPPKLSDARVETRDASAGLEPAFRAAAAAASPVWIAWAVPASQGGHLCCGDGFDGWGCSRPCSLEDGKGSESVNFRDRGDLEGGDSRALIFSRVERGHTTRLRLFSDECTIRGGGMPVVWLLRVRPAESVAFLARLVADAPREEGDADEGKRPGQRALTAIALHDDASADLALERFALPGPPDGTRQKAIFWLGNSRGRRGYEVLRRLAAEEQSDGIRKHVTFGLSQSKVPEAIETLIGMAKRDVSPRVRGQALFWLAHKAGRKATEAIDEAIRDDPETEVKKKAVFALTQLPAEESTTQLIRVARTNRNAQVRKQALFWLGQSKDPRALAYIEEVLTR